MWKDCSDGTQTHHWNIDGEAEMSYRIIASDLKTATFQILENKPITNGDDSTTEPITNVDSGTTKPATNLDNSTTTKSENVSGTTLKAVFDGKDSITLTWSKVSNVSGYQILRTDQKNGKYKVVKTISKKSSISYSFKGLKKKKIYYYKVRAYKTVKGKRIYGKSSSIKSVTVK